MRKMKLTEDRLMLWWPWLSGALMIGAFGMPIIQSRLNASVAPTSPVLIVSLVLWTLGGVGLIEWCWRCFADPELIGMAYAFTLLASFAMPVLADVGLAYVGCLGFAYYVHALTGPNHRGEGGPQE